MSDNTPTEVVDLEPLLAKPDPEKSRAKAVMVGLGIIGVLFILYGLIQLVTGNAWAQGSDQSAKAYQLGRWIDEQSAIYDEKEQEIQALTAALSAAHEAQDKARETASGYRKALCTEFGLKRANREFVSALPSECQDF